MPSKARTLALYVFITFCLVELTDTCRYDIAVVVITIASGTRIVMFLEIIATSYLSPLHLFELVMIECLLSELCDRPVQ